MKTESLTALVRQFLALYGLREPSESVIGAYLLVLRDDRYGWDFLRVALTRTIPGEMGEGVAPAPLTLQRRLNELVNLEQQAAHPQAAMPEVERQYWRYIEAGADPRAAASICGLDHESLMQRITAAIDQYMQPGQVHDGWPHGHEPQPQRPGDLSHAGGMTPARIEQLVCMRLLGQAALAYGISGMLRAYLTACGGSRRVLAWTVPVGAALCHALADVGLASRRPAEDDAMLEPGRQERAQQVRADWLTMLRQKAIGREGSRLRVVPSPVFERTLEET
jgi:hypothetical protein